MLCPMTDELGGSPPLDNVLDGRSWKQPFDSAIYRDMAFKNRYGFVHSNCFVFRIMLNDF